ncbi:MAG: Inner-membrane translocator [Petrotoga mobilis]|nr:MAG: Inner-membrane translocator [Petrotoga mobilis]
MLNFLHFRLNKTFLIFLAFLVVIAIWKPIPLIYGLQRGGLYSLIGLPLALILGIVGILNLAHGDFLTLGLYIGYIFFTQLGLDPLISVFPLFILMFLLAIGIYQISIKYVLKAGELNQLLLTFGISMVIIELIKIIWTTRPRNIYTPYASSSITIANFSIGIYEFIYPIVAIGVLVFLQLFLKKTFLGQASRAVGQNPKGAEIVGIDTNKVYLIIFAIAFGIIGIAAGIMLPRTSIFPLSGNAYTLKSFALAAMAGLGNLNGILIGGITLGVVEAVVQSIPGYSGWSDLVFFGVLIIVILIRAYRGSKS